jgi:hypothetical protein
VIEVRVADLTALIAAVRRSVGAPARLYLVAGTSHLAQGWRERVARLELAGDPGASDAAVRAAGAALELPLVWESPADVVPLPRA